MIDLTLRDTEGLGFAIAAEELVTQIAEWRDGRAPDALPCPDEGQAATEPEAEAVAEPEEVVRSQFEARRNGDTAAARELISPRLAVFLSYDDQARGITYNRPGPLEIFSSTIVEPVALVDVSYPNLYTGGDVPECSIELQQFILVQSDGWKIDEVVSIDSAPVSCGDFTFGGQAKVTRLD